MYEMMPLLIGFGGISIFGLAVVGFILMAISSSVTIVDAYEQKAVTRFGEYQGLLEEGLHFIWPFVSKTYTFDMRTQTLDIPQQEAITRDNSPVTADAVIYIKVMDAKRAFLEVDDYKRAVSNLAQTTLRAVLGDMELDDTLNKRQEINAKIRNELDEPTDEWGIRVESVEVREVNPSRDVQEAMEKQTSAERTRRAMILEAQGERRSAVEEAQGKKESNIIEAQGEKQSQILEAQGDAVSTVLRARAAESMGERAVIEKGMETLSEVGQGDSNTFVIPQELTALVSRYGGHVSGGEEGADGEPLLSQDFDEETADLLGIGDIDEILNQADAEAQDALDSVEDEDIKDPDDIIDNDSTEQQ